MGIISPLNKLRYDMKEDHGLAWAWHCNIAMPIMDSINCSHKDANIASSAVMRHVFGIDITQFEEYTDIMGKPE